MKVKATFKGVTQEFMTNEVNEHMLPALGRDGKLYFYMSVEHMGQFTKIDALNGNMGFLTDDKKICFVLVINRGKMNNKARCIINSEIWDKCNGGEEYIELDKNFNDLMNADTDKDAVKVILYSFEKNLEYVNIIHTEELANGALFMLTELTYPTEVMKVPIIYYPGENWVFTPFIWQTANIESATEINNVKWRVNNTDEESVAEVGIPVTALQVAIKQMIDD